MTTSFANRLAAGGVWVIKFAERISEVSEDMRERGFGPLPLGDGSPRHVFNYAGRDAFNWLIDGYLPEGHHARVDMQLLDTKYVARNGSPISEELWLQHLKDEDYRQIAYSVNPYKSVVVVTVWTGVCLNGDPNIFRTLVFRPCTGCRKIHPSHVAMSPTEERARNTHQAVVNALHAGQL
jgi:hypothetical protein